MTRENDTSGGDLRALLAMLRRRLALIVFAVAVVTALAVGFSSVQEKRYDAEASLLFKPLYLDAQVTGLPLQLPGDAARDAETNLRLVSSPDIRERAAARLGGGYTAANLKNKVDVKTAGESNLITITGKGATPAEASRIANTMAGEYVASRQETIRGQITRAINRVRSQIERSQGQSADIRKALRDNLEKLRLLGSVQTADAQVSDRATPPSKPSAPKPVRNGVFGGLIGLVLGLGLALAAEQLDGRVRRPEQLEDVFGVPALGAIPQSKRLKGDRGWINGLTGVEAEAFRRLRANLRYYGGDGGVESVVLTSALPGSGKTTIALHLAAAAAAGGTKVLLVEADLRRPKLARMLDLPDDTGGLSTTLAELGDASAKKADAAARKQIRQVHASNVGENGQTPSTFAGSFDVLTAGPVPVHASELLDSDTMEMLLDGWSEAYELVVVDGAPGLVSDSIPLMKGVDGVLVVGRVGRESMDALEELRRDFDQVDIRPVGVVANFTKVQPGYKYYSADA